MKVIALATLLPSTSASSASFAAAEGSRDLARARQPKPGLHLRAEDQPAISAMLSSAFSAVAPTGATIKPCETFTASELSQTLALLHAVADPALQKLYETRDDNRRMRVVGTYTSDLETMKSKWATEAKILATKPYLHDIARDGKCHEVMMWFTHHLSQDAREHAAQLTALPLLPTGGEHIFSKKHIEEGTDDAYVRDHYRQGLGCGLCHSTGQTPKNTEYVEWPEEVDYHARGFGPFPFWDNTGPGCSTCSKAILPGTNVHVQYSAKQGSENLMHGNCTMSWVKGGPMHKPCNHLFVKGKGAWIYTPKVSNEPEADGEFCCRTYAAKDALVAPPRDWMKSMKYAGVGTKWNGYYQHPAQFKKYTLNAPFSFWYYTDMEDKPLEQGEGCRQPNGWPSKRCSGSLPALFFHDYNQTSFINASWSADTFAIPAVCQTTTIGCQAPGGTGPDRWGGPVTHGAALAGVHLD